MYFFCVKVLNKNFSLTIGHFHYFHHFFYLESFNADVAIMKKNLGHSNGYQGGRGLVSSWGLACFLGTMNSSQSLLQMLLLVTIFVKVYCTYCRPISLRKKALISAYTVFYNTIGIRTTILCKYRHKLSPTTICAVATIHVATRLMFQTDIITDWQTGQKQHKSDLWS